MNKFFVSNIVLAYCEKKIALKYRFFKNLFHYECASCQLTISSHQNQNGETYNALRHIIYCKKICCNVKIMHVICSRHSSETVLCLLRINVLQYLLYPHSNFDDWKWSIEKWCIHNEITSSKIHTLVIEKNFCEMDCNSFKQ